MLHQSMAKRKQTTESPEKIPMKTDRMRKKRSSRKTVFHTFIGLKASWGASTAG